MPLAGASRYRSGMRAIPKHATHPPRSALGVTAAWTLVAIAIIAHVAATMHDPAMRWTMADLQVYREAAIAAQRGVDVYTTDFSGSSLPFLYPPFALAVFNPLGWISLFSAQLGTTLVSAVCLYLIVRRAWLLGAHPPNHFILGSSLLVRIALGKRTYATEPADGTDQCGFGADGARGCNTP